VIQPDAAAPRRSSRSGGTHPPGSASVVPAATARPIVRNVKAGTVGAMDNSPVSSSESFLSTFRELVADEEAPPLDVAPFDLLPEAQGGNE
jgi:hypothetical protein